MKKIEYKAPEMEVIEMKYNKMLMASSGEIAPGTDDSEGF